MPSSSREASVFLTFLAVFHLQNVLVILLPCDTSAFVSQTSAHGGISPSRLLRGNSIASANTHRAISPDQLSLGEFLGNGTFGSVRRGILSCGDESGEILSNTEIKVVTKTAKLENDQALSYLDTEAYINSRLCLERKESCPYFAPYLGDCILPNGERHLIWKESGSSTLEDYLNGKDGGLERLAKALNMPPPGDSERHTLAREILRQILVALSYSHAIGICHRDLKPSNCLVDEEAKCLRLIDFGSACDMSSWLERRGYRGSERGIRTILYCAPEEFVEAEHPYAFDVYSAAVTWLRIVIPGLRVSEDALFEARVGIRDEQHDLEKWVENTALSSDKELPRGWETFFACTEGRESWRLLVGMMKYEPSARPTATDALLSTYLNPSCSESSRPEPPPVPWSLTSHLETLALMQKSYDECVLSDAFFGKVISVEMPTRNDLVLEDRSPNGVVVASVGMQEEGIQAGDQLLEIGPIDVEKANLHHVDKILTQWPKPTVALQFRREE